MYLIGEMCPPRKFERVEMNQMKPINPSSIPRGAKYLNFVGPGAVFVINGTFPTVVWI